MTGEPLLELEVGALAAGGGCVAHAEDGRVVFVRHALPGERVRAHVTSSTARFLRADAVEVLAPSPDRVTPPCPLAGPGRCGGCDLQHVRPERQRELKAGLVREQLLRVARLDVPVAVEPVPGAPDDGTRWRTRVSYAVDAGGRAGLHRHRSDRIEPVERCVIATDEVHATGATGGTWTPGVAVEAAADGTQRVVAVSSGAPGAQRRTGAAGAEASGPGTGSVAAQGRSAPARSSPLTAPACLDAGLTVDRRAVSGPHGLRHSVLGRRFEVAAGGFWQVHAGAAELLAGAVLDALEPAPGESAVDLYAGVGLFAALIGERVGRQGSVLAVESDPRACADAARNSADLPQVKIRTARVEPALLARWAPAGSVDLVVLDPPRTGLGVESARALARLRPRRLAYVSCDPATFARDLRVLLDAGWRLPALRAFDLFPMTEHVELLATLEPPR